MHAAPCKDNSIIRRCHYFMVHNIFYCITFSTDNEFTFTTPVKYYLFCRGTKEPAAGEHHWKSIHKYTSNVSDRFGTPITKYLMKNFLTVLNSSLIFSKDLIWPHVHLSQSGYGWLEGQHTREFWVRGVHTTLTPENMKWISTFHNSKIAHLDEH